MATANTSIRVIDYVTRQNSSVNGNPAYMVYFTDGSSARTMSDSSCAYEIQNLSHSRYKGAELLITWTKAGRIQGIEIVNMPAEQETQEQRDAALYYVNLNN